MQSFAKGSTNKYLPICFCLDLTESMAGEGVAVAKQIIQTFFSSMKKSETEGSGLTVDCAIVTFGGRKQITVVRDFASVAEVDLQLDYRKVGGFCSGLEAIDYCLQLIEKRKTEYKNYGISYRRPWLFFISDGQWDEADFSSSDRLALTHISNYQFSKKIWLLPIEAGDCISDNLKNLTLNKKSLDFNGISFKELTMTLSASISRAVVSTQQVEKAPIDILNEAIAQAKAWNVLQKKGGS